MYIHSLRVAVQIYHSKQNYEIMAVKFTWMFLQIAIMIYPAFVTSELHKLTSLGELVK